MVACRSRTLTAPKLPGCCSPATDLCSDKPCGQAINVCLHGCHSRRHLSLEAQALGALKPVQQVGRQTAADNLADAQTQHRAPSVTAGESVCVDEYRYGLHTTPLKCKGAHADAGPYSACTARHEGAQRTTSCCRCCCRSQVCGHMLS